MRYGLALVVVATSILVAACSRDAAPPPQPARDDAGTKGCNPGELTLDDGTCQPAGIPPEMCGAGFKPDGNMGCDPILPPQPCPKGQMAVPGETQCHDVAPCADGNWGDIPVEANTQFVDASYAGGASGGSQGKPWTKIGDAVNAAAPGAIVAIAKGSYAEDVWTRTKPVRLWGRCPSLVEIVGTGQQLCAVLAGEQTSGYELRDLAVRSPTAGAGVCVSGAKGAIVDRVWVHDTERRGLNAEETLGATSVTVTRSLIEAAHEVGLYVGGSVVTVQSTVIRDTGAWGSDPKALRGLGVERSASTGRRANVTVTECVFERNTGGGIFVLGSDAAIGTTVVRDTQGGHGVGVQDAPVANAKPARARVKVQQSLVERNQSMEALIVGSDATFDATVFRDTLGSAALDGTGIAVIDDSDTLAPATLTVSACLLERNRIAGVVAASAKALVGATIDTTIVRDTGATAGAFGDGVVVISNVPGTGATVNASRIETSARAGVSNFGAQVALSSTTFEYNTIDLDGESSDFSFDTSAGGNVCGCGGSGATCVVVSSGLAPPPSIGSR